MCKLCLADLHTFSEATHSPAFGWNCLLAFTKAVLLDHTTVTQDLLKKTTHSRLSAVTSKATVPYDWYKASHQGCKCQNWPSTILIQAPRSQISPFIQRLRNRNKCPFHSKSLSTCVLYLKFCYFIFQCSQSKHNWVLYTPTKTTPLGPASVQY